MYSLKISSIRYVSEIFYELRMILISFKHITKLQEHYPSTECSFKTKVYTLGRCLEEASHRIERLQKINIHVHMDCIFCNSVVEYFDHLYFEISMTRILWGQDFCTV